MTLNIDDVIYTSFSILLTTCPPSLPLFRQRERDTLYDAMRPHTHTHISQLINVVVPISSAFSLSSHQTAHVSLSLSMTTTGLLQFVTTDYSLEIFEIVSHQYCLIHSLLNPSSLITNVIVIIKDEALFDSF